MSQRSEAINRWMIKKGIFVLTVCVSVLRCDCVHAYRKHCLRRRRRGLHDPPQRPSYHDHPHLPPLTLLQTHRGTSRGGAQGIYTSIPPCFISCEKIKPVCLHLRKQTMNSWCWCFSDHALLRRQEHGLGVVRWQEETGDLPWRQVGPHRQWRWSRVNEAEDNKFNSLGSCIDTLLHKLTHLLNRPEPSRVYWARSAPSFM